MEEAPGSNPSQELLLIHGILGSKGNWRAFARRLVSRHPRWRVILADLRNHGSFRDAEPPHTVEACARDILRMLGSLGRFPRLVWGHSFGGKVALLLGHLGREQGIGEVWSLDSPPGRRPGGSEPELVRKLLAALAQAPPRFEKRRRMVDWLQRQGFSREIGLWMTTNLVASPTGGYTFTLDLQAIGEMIDSYLETDAIPLVKEAARYGLKIGFIRGGKSLAWLDPEILELARLEQRGRIQLALLPNAGHWLHTDDPEGLLALLEPSLATKE